MYTHIHRVSEQEGNGQKGRGIIFKKLVHMIVVPGRPEICRAGWQPGNSAKS